MQIIPSKLIQQGITLPVKNRTLTFLFGSLKLEDPLAYAHLVSIENSLVGVFVDDETCAFKSSHSIFVAIDQNVRANIVEKTITKLTHCESYVRRYTYSLYDSVMIMVFRVCPISHYHFMLGEYSKMYTKSQLEHNIFLLGNENIVGLMNKTLKARQAFCKVLKIAFDTDIKEPELGDVECDLPPYYSKISKALEVITLQDDE